MPGTLRDTVSGTMRDAVHVVGLSTISETSLLSEHKPMIWSTERSMGRFLSRTYFLLFMHYAVVAGMGTYCLLEKSVPQFIMNAVKEKEIAYTFGWYSWIGVSLILGICAWIRDCCVINIICYLILTLAHTLFVLMLIIYVVELFLISYIGIAAALLFLTVYTKQKSYECEDTFLTCVLICMPLGIWACALSSNYTYWEAGSKQRWWHFLVYCQASFHLFCHKGTVCQILNGKFEMKEKDYMFAALTALTYFTAAPIITIIRLIVFIIHWFWIECEMKKAISYPTYELRSNEATI